jgi:acetyl esterase
MPLAPEIQALVDGMAQDPDALPIHLQSLDEARAGYVALGNMFGPGEAVAKVIDRSVPGPAGEIPIRCYWPSQEAGLPIVVFFHGGGWTIGDLDTHDKECRAIANGAQALVVSVDYRLGPEHKYPAAADDCFAALQWVGQHGSNLGGDPSRIAVAGDSAGGNLSAVVSLLARDGSGPALRAQVLVYPCVDMRRESTEAYPSRLENAAGPFLLKESMDYFEACYIADDTQRREPKASPLLATSHADLPPALVITAEFDPLRDEGETYAGVLEAAGVAVTTHRYDGQPHVFFQLSPIAPAGKELLQEISAFLTKAFA